MKGYKRLIEAGLGGGDFLRAMERLVEEGNGYFRFGEGEQGGLSLVSVLFWIQCSHEPFLVQRLKTVYTKNIIVTCGIFHDMLLKSTG